MRRSHGRLKHSAKRGRVQGAGAHLPVARAPARMVGPALDSARPAAQVKVDADFFNAFADDFDEDDMRPGAARA